MATPYLTPAAIKASAPRLAAEGDDRLADLVAEFEEVAEDYRGVAFTDRGQDPGQYPGRPYTAPPRLLVRATLEYVHAVVTSTASGTSRDVVAVSVDGSWTRFSTPDIAAGRPTGWTEVDRLLNSLPDYRLPGFG